MSISDKMVTVAENMEKVFAAGARAAGGGASVLAATPDWNANEGEDGYIANRTHWKGIGLNPWLAEIKVKLSKTYKGDFLGTVSPTANADGTYPTFTAGKKYIVKYDDEDPIECEAFYSNVTSTTSYLAVGNPSLIKDDNYSREDNGLNFFFVITAANGSKASLYARDNSNHTIAIYEPYDEYHTIDPRYIPFSAIVDAVANKITLHDLPYFTLEIEGQDGAKKNCVICGYVKGSYEDTTGIPVFDLKVEEKDGTEVTYKVFGYEYSGGTE